MMNHDNSSTLTISREQVLITGFEDTLYSLNALSYICVSYFNV